MKIASVADLRNNFATISRWIYEGENVAIQKHGHAFAVLSPTNKKKKIALQWPDYESRLKRYCTGGSFKGATAAEIIEDMRGDF